MPTIPSGMQPVVESYAIGPPDGVTRTEVGGGMPRYALEWDRGAQQFRVTLVLDAVKFSVWTAFFHHVVKKGAISFEMDLDSGFGVQPHQVNVMPETYGVTRNGSITVVSFSVEAESSVYDMTGEEALELIEFYEEVGAASSALLIRLDIFANQDTLVLIP